MKKIINRVLKKSLFVSVVLLVVGFLTMQKGYASENSFSVSPLDPRTNLPQGSFYDLNVQPGETQVIKIRLINSEAQEVKVHVGLNNGTTNNNGITSYLDNKTHDSTLKVPFSSLATISNDIIAIPGKGNIDVPITLRVPDKAFDGQILGGIRVTLSEPSESQKKNKDDLKAAVTTHIAYTIGVVLHEKEQLPDPEMHLLSVQPEQRNSHNFISATLRNAAPRIIKKLTAESQIYKKGSDKVLYSAFNNDMRMAPNSHFNFGISLQNQALEAGDYLLKIKGKADGKPYEFSKAFTITAKEADEGNEIALYTEKPKSNNLLLWFIILLLIFLLLIFFVFYMLKRKERGNNEE